MTGAHLSMYEQQGWTAISAAPLHVLVRGDAASPAVTRARAAAASGDLEDVLDALVRDGVSRAPDFAAAVLADPVRVVTRGSAYAVVSAPTGPREFRAGPRGPWHDDDAPAGTTHVALHTGEAAPVEPPPPPPAVPGEPEATVVPGEPASPAPAGQPERSRSGWRLPARLGREEPAPVPAASVPAASVPPASVSPAPPPVPVHPAADEVEDLPSYDHLFGATQHGAPQYLGNHDTDSIAEPPIGQAPLESAGGFSPTAPAPADHTLPPPAETGRAPAAARPSQPLAAPPPLPPAAPAEPAPPLPAPGGGLIDSVPWRSGGSNVAPPDLPDPAPAPRAGGVHTPPPAPSLRPAALPPPAPAPEQPAGRPQPSEEEPSAEAPVWEADDEAEATVDRSALLSAQAAADAGPLVLAVLCPAGHPSPPHAGSCRACGRDIPVQQPFETPRPALGLLRLSTGDVVSLDRGVLLGRSPKVNADLPVADRPHLVRVASPENDISRNHVEVTLDGWHVLVRDLGSTNGTTVALPGQVPVRLRPSDQQVIEPGTVVTLADEVSFTFEVGA